MTDFCINCGHELCLQTEDCPGGRHYERQMARNGDTIPSQAERAQHAPFPDYASEPPLIAFATEDTVKLCPDCGDEVSDDEIHCANCDEDAELTEALMDEFFEVIP